MSTANADPIAQLKSEVEARCPVSDNLANATPVHLSMKLSE
ncbi:hypothetical protein [Pyxidicoccus trucidator]|nr:hypothetical protein [Pyxidicoccus trucidator]